MGFEAFLYLILISLMQEFAKIDDMRKVCRISNAFLYVTYVDKDWPTGKTARKSKSLQFLLALLYNRRA